MGTLKKYIYNQASAPSRSTSEYARLRLPVGLNPERERRRVRFGEEAVAGDAAAAKEAARDAAGAVGSQGDGGSVFGGGGGRSRGGIGRCGRLPTAAKGARVGREALSRISMHLPEKILCQLGLGLGSA